jgi:hypothetical protein
MNDLSHDPICALATANGTGAIAVIRVSGTGAKALVSKAFSKDLQALPSHTVHLGWMRSASGERLDEVLATLFDNGKSFTGEESVELACHGSPYIQQLLLQRLVEVGCRMAEPGEFTKRAFLNGRLDLSQAEAVADLIAAQSKQAHQVALQQLRGRFSSELQQLREQLINFAALIELELDFAEEGDAGAGGEAVGKPGAVEPFAEEGGAGGIGEFGFEEAEAGALAHMNEDHAEALALYAEKLCGAPKGRWRASGLDPEGMDLALGDQTTRLVFPSPLSGPDELRNVLVALAAQARA